MFYLFFKRNEKPHILHVKTMAYHWSEVTPSVFLNSL